MLQRRCLQRITSVHQHEFRALIRNLKASSQPASGTCSRIFSTDIGVRDYRLYAVGVIRAAHAWGFGPKRQFWQDFFIQCNISALDVLSSHKPVHLVVVTKIDDENENRCTVLTNIWSVLSAVIMTFKTSISSSCLRFCWFPAPLEIFFAEHFFQFSLKMFMFWKLQSYI